ASPAAGCGAAPGPAVRTPPHTAPPPGGAPPPPPAELAAFARGAGIVIHDAQSLPADMPEKLGWGHSLIPDVLALGREAETRCLALFHHDPSRDDDALAAIERDAVAWAAERAPAMKVLVAAEGMTLQAP